MTTISEEQKAKAEAIKNEANAHFKGKNVYSYMLFLN